MATQWLFLNVPILLHMELSDMIFDCPFAQISMSFWTTAFYAIWEY